MMSDILYSSVPLILYSFGALFSEFAGVLAVFADGVINFGAFLSYAFTVYSGNAVAGVFASCFVCTVSVLGFAWITEKTKMNPFLSATALNLLFSSLCSVFSSLLFKTRGVLVENPLVQNVTHAKTVILILALFIVILSMCFLFKTPHGLYLRITGSDSDVLEVKGISPSSLRIYAWGITAFFCALAGGILAVRINSFVPNISAGRGWIALAAVFLGRKKVLWVTLSVCVFCAADYFGINLQAILPSTAMNAVPYFAALLFLAFVPAKKKLYEPK